MFKNTKFSISSWEFCYLEKTSLVVAIIHIHQGAVCVFSEIFCYIVSITYAFSVIPFQMLG